MRDLIGLKVKMDRPVDRDRPRCRNVCIIGAGKGPHARRAPLRGSQSTSWLVVEINWQWIERVASRFGAPTTPIVVRKAHTFEEGEAPDTNANSQ